MSDASADRRHLMLATLGVSAASVLAAAAQAAEGPPGRAVENSSLDGPTQGKGVADAVLASIGLGNEKVRLRGHRLRLRRLVIEPGGEATAEDHRVVHWWRSTGRVPAVILSADVFEAGEDAHVMSARRPPASARAGRMRAAYRIHAGSDVAAPRRGAASSPRAQPERLPRKEGPSMTADPTASGPPPGWEAMMEAAQQGDGRAYQQVLRQILPLLREIARRRIANRADAEDAVQETLLTLHRLRHAYDPRRPLRPWLIAICERRCVDHLRRVGRRPPMLPWSDATAITLPQADNGEAAIARLEAIELREAVARLPPAQREAVQLGGLAQMPLKEVGSLTGRSRGALKVATHRALRSLRLHLGVRA